MKFLNFIILIFLYFNPLFAQLSINTDIRILKAQSDEGNAEAKFFLGALYYTGKAVEQDFSEAIKLFEESSNSGYTSATYNLGVVYAKGIKSTNSKEFFYLLLTWDLFTFFGFGFLFLFQ